MGKDFVSEACGVTEFSFVHKLLCLSVLHPPSDKTVLFTEGSNNTL